MSMKTLSPFLLIASLTLSGCMSTTPAAQDTSAVRARIDEGVAAWTAAVNRGDMAAVADLYTEDAMLMPPNGAALRGRDAVRTFFVEALSSLSPRDVKLSSDEVEVCGDSAYEVGRYQMTVQPSGGAAMNDRGKYLVVWRRQSDGSWKIARDIFNSDLAAAGAAH